MTTANSGHSDTLYHDNLEQRLSRVFGIDIETCPACGRAVRIIACIDDPDVIEKILNRVEAPEKTPKV